MANETSTKPAEMPLKAQLLKLAVEVGPLAVFFLANAGAGIFWGTGLFMVATIASLIVSRILFGRIPVMPLVSGACVLVFGGLTLAGVAPFTVFGGLTRRPRTPAWRSTRQRPARSSERGGR